MSSYLIPYPTVEYQFQETFTNPFNAWKRVYCSLWNKDPEDPLRWELELIPLNLGYRILRFLCSFKYDYIIEPEILIANRLEIAFHLNNSPFPISQNVIVNYAFGPATRYKYCYEVEIANYDERNSNKLVACIEIKRRIEGIGERVIVGERNNAVRLLQKGPPEDMLTFGTQLWILQYFGDYCTLNVLSVYNTTYPVHHCMLKTRWTNFFRLHNLDEDSTSVNTAISCLVLRNILEYIYSCRIDTNPVFWRDLAFASEFFQVIFRYQIHHMYSALRQKNMKVAKDILNSEDVRNISIELRYMKQTCIRRQSISSPIYVYSYAPSCDHIFQFSIHVKHENLAGPWLSYSILSQTDTPFSIRVILEMPGSRGSRRLINVGDYNIPGNGSVISGPLLYLGCRETFSGRSHSHKKLSFGLIFRNGESSALWRLSYPEEITENTTELFSQHMGDVLLKRCKADLVVLSRFPRNGCSKELGRIHKFIFKTRVPKWWQVVEPNLVADADLPNEIALNLSYEGYHFVESYMYTGKTPYIPNGLRQEIWNFANNGEFDSLAVFVANMD